MKNYVEMAINPAFHYHQAAQTLREDILLPYEMKLQDFSFLASMLTPDISISQRCIDIRDSNHQEYENQNQNRNKDVETLNI